MKILNLFLCVSKDEWTEGQMDVWMDGQPTDRYCVYKCVETYFQVKLKKKLVLSCDLFFV